MPMPLEKAKLPFTWILLRLRPLLRGVKKLRGTPRAIAGGFSVGLFLALTPTIGVQLIIAVFLATFLKLSRPATLVSVMVTNPVTIPPVFTFNYWVGKVFFDGPSVREVYGHLMGITSEIARMNFWQVGEQVITFAEIGRDMLIPLFFGSFIVASAAALLSYALISRGLNFLLRHKKRKSVGREHGSAAAEERMEGET